MLVAKEEHGGALLGEVAAEEFDGGVEVRVGEGADGFGEGGVGGFQGFLELGGVSDGLGAGAGGGAAERGDEHVVFRKDEVEDLADGADAGPGTPVVFAGHGSGEGRELVAELAGVRGQRGLDRGWGGGGLGVQAVQQGEGEGGGEQGEAFHGRSFGKAGLRVRLPVSHRLVLLSAAVGGEIWLSVRLPGVLT